VIETGFGIILRTRPLTDTSLIVHWLTAEQGRLATVAKGARRAKSSFQGKLDLFYEGSMSFQRSSRSELHALREVVIQATHAPLRVDFACLSQAAYAVALLEQMTEIETPVPELFELFIGYIRHLASQPVRPRNIFAFELKFLVTLGLEPGWKSQGTSVELQELSEALIGATWAELTELQPTGRVVRELQSFLHGFILQHCGKIPRGRAEALGTV